MNHPLESKFRKVLASFTATLKGDVIEKFRSVTLDDLKQTVTQIQEEQESALRSESMRRLGAFFEAVEEYDKIIQNFLLTPADFFAFIWGPAKFILEISASNSLKYLDLLLNAYERIGENIPLLKQYESAIKKSPEMQVVLPLFYEDVLHFQRILMSIFKLKGWKQMCEILWPKYQSRVDAVVNSLQSHKSLLDTRTMLFGMQEIHRIGAEMEDWREARHKDETARRKREVSTWLGAADSTEDQEIATEARSKCPMAGRRILRERLITRWCDPNSRSGPCLWINGKPGVGKTVFSSVLVEHCANNTHTNLAYFYCRADDCNKNTFIGVCKSIICQLAFQDASVLSYVYEKSSSSRRGQLDSMTLAKEMLDVVLNSFDRLFIVIDGVDECNKFEKDLIYSTFISYAENPTSSLRCCFISQEDQDTGTLFRNIPTFQITKQHTGDDIMDYCVSIEKEITEFYQYSDLDIPHLDMFEHLDISRKVAAKADGIFLFARLVMENLLQQCTMADLQNEVDRIPSDLDKAYDRLLVRFLQDAPLPKQQIAKQILAWVLCAQRPLKWHEIQGAMSVDTERSILSHQGRKLTKDPKPLCGSFIEIQRSGTVVLVHQTARSFLEKQDALCLGLEEVNITCVCLRNLTFPSHDDNNSEDSIRAYIREGYYALSDYSVAYWCEHLKRAIRGRALDRRESFETLSRAILAFLDRRFTPNTGNMNRIGRLSSCFGRFKDEAFYPRLVQAMTDAGNEEGGPVLPQLLTVRDVMERVLLDADPGIKRNLHRKYGQHIFKCPELQCTFFHQGFPTASERNAHKDKHRRAFFCPYTGCPSTRFGFVTLAEFTKHVVDSHATGVETNSLSGIDDVASVDIAMQIKHGNLRAVKAWANQLRTRIPIEKLWFPSRFGRFDKSPLGMAISCGKPEIFTALLFQVPDELLNPTNDIVGDSSLHHRYQLFADAMRSGNEEIAAIYLRMLERIDVTLFTTALRLQLGTNMITLLLRHATSGGSKAFLNNAASFLKVAVGHRHEVAARYLLLDLGFLEDLHERQMRPVITDLMFCGDNIFLRRILPAHEALWIIDNARLHHCCNTGNSCEITTLLENDHIDLNFPDSSGHTPLINAIEKEHYEMAQQIVEDSRVIVEAHQDDQAMSALHWAVRNRNSDCVGMLLNAAMPFEEITRPVLVDAVETTALELSRKQWSSAMVTAQLQDYLNANTNWNLYPEDSSRLIRTCATGNIRQVQNTLQRAPQDLNTPDSRGVTPVLQAVKRGQHQIVQFLLDNECDIQCFEEPERLSPLMFAVIRKDLEMIRILLSKARMDPSYENAEGKTALDYLEPGSTFEEEIIDAMEGAMDLASV